MDDSFILGPRSNTEFQIQSAGNPQFPDHIEIAEALYNPRVHSPVSEYFYPEIHSTFSAAALTQRLESVVESDPVANHEMVMDTVVDSSNHDIVVESVVDTSNHDMVSH